MTSQVKLCSNCKWMTEPGTWAKCVAPQVTVPTGFDTGRYCSIQRGDSFLMAVMMGSCGPRGRWFAPKD